MTTNLGNRADLFAGLKQYDDFVINFNEKFAKPGQTSMQALYDQKLLTPKPAEFDEVIEWTWYLLWHHEGHRARHGASMMAPDYAHWYGTFEVADRFYMQLPPQAREIAQHAEGAGKKAAADAVRKAIDDVLARPERQWFVKAKPKPAAAAGLNSPAVGAASD